MDTSYFFYDEKNKETQQLGKDEYRRVHDENYANAQTQEDKNLASQDYFHGIRAKTNAILPQKLEMEYSAGKSYKDKLTPEQRAQSLMQMDSDLYQKKENAKRILEAQAGIPVQLDKVCTTMAKKSNCSKNDLKPIALFYGKKKSDNTALTGAWLERDINPQGMLTEVLKNFLKISFNGLDLSTDKKLSKNAPFMESLCLQYDSVIGILTDYREEYNKLDPAVKDLVENKIGEAGGLVNYYRLMKVVITNPYYVTHENRELSVKAGAKDSAEKKRLINQLWLAKGGLRALTDYGAKKLDESLERLCGNLQTNIVTDKQLKVQDQLSERHDEIEQNGLSNYLDSVDKKQNNSRLSKTEKNLYERARKGISELPLPDKVEDAAGSITSILDQLQFVESLIADKIDHKNFYYLEHNYKDIAVVDQVASLSAPLTKLKKAVLSVCNITSQGFMKAGKVSAAKRKEAQLKYESALLAYKSGMSMVEQLRDAKMMPEDATQMKELIKESEKARRGKIKQKANVTEKEKEAVREKIKDMMMTLSNSKFSEYSIYENATKIMNLNVERRQILGDEAGFSNFMRIAYLAEYFWIRRRRDDITEALKQKELTEKEIADLNAEDKELAPFIESNGAPLDVVENSLEELQRIRKEADIESRDLADLKATASHYLFQEEWSRNSNRAKDGWIKKASRNFFSGITRFLGWIFSKPKTTDHGKGRYQESKEKMNLLPEGIETFGNQGAVHTISHGDGSVAPAIELNKYHKDPMKLAISEDYAAISQLMTDNADYPDYLKDAVEALSNYTKVRGIVNNDTFEMEHAFLDTFKSGVEQLIKDDETRTRYPALGNKMLQAFSNIMILSNGNLELSMTPAERMAVAELKSIYTSDTYTGGDMKESNMQFLPLFPHEPMLNDIKQGTTGDCYLLAAIQKVVYDDPKAIRDMFHDLGDGNVIVRLYAPFGEITDSKGVKSYQRIDDPDKMNNYTMRPVYVKVRKQYSTGDAQNTDSMWVQLLEKAYAAAGFNSGNAEVKEDGELLNMNKELTDGSSRTALAHLTGQKYVTIKTNQMAITTIEQSWIDKTPVDQNIQKAFMFKGIDANLGHLIYVQLYHAKKDAAKNETCDNDYEKKLVEKAVSKALANWVSDKDLQTFADNLEALKKTGRLTDDEAKSLAFIAKTRYDNSAARVSKLTSRILGNIKKPDEKITKSPESYPYLRTINSKIKELLKSQKAKQEDEKEQASLYDDISKIVNEKTKHIKNFVPLSKEENNAHKYSVKNYMMLNPGDIYTQDELAILRLVKEGTMNGRAVPIENDGHCMTALDVKYHKGKWFILIRDPFNVFRTEYKTVNEKIEKSEYGLGSTFTQHFKIRDLSPDLKQGFLGTCWWELKDAVKNINMIHKVAEN